LRPGSAIRPALAARRSRVGARRLRAWHQGRPADDVDSWKPTPPRHDGRYHVAGGTRTWYGSSNEDACWAEFLRHQVKPDIDPRQIRRRVGQVELELVVLDLTNPAIRDLFGVGASDLIADDYTVCQAIAVEAIAHGFEAILAPSAALPDETTLAVFGRAIKDRGTDVQDDGIKQAPARVASVLPKVRPRTIGPE
jgi:RES domain-containing protein